MTKLSNSIILMVRISLAYLGTLRLDQLRTLIDAIELASFS